MRHKWTDSEKAYLREDYFWLGPDEMVKRLRWRFGIKVTRDAVKNQAIDLGIAGEIPPGWYSVPEANLLLGLKSNVLHRRIKNGTVKARKGRRITCISAETFDELMVYYHPEVPWPAVTPAQAAHMLSYVNEYALTKAIRNGHIESCKAGGRRWIRRSDIERAQEYLKRTGFVQVHWAKLKAG